MISAKMNARTKRWSRDDLKQNNYDVSHSNAACHAYPNAEKQLATFWYQRDMKSKAKDPREKTGARTSPCASTTNATQMQHVTHTQTQTKPLTTTCNKSLSARHEIPQKDATRKSVGTTTSPKINTTHARQMQHVPHTQVQTKPLTTTCNKLISARNEVRK